MSSTNDSNPVRYYQTNSKNKFHIIPVNKHGQPNFRENNKGIIDAFPFCGLSPLNPDTKLYESPPESSNVCLKCYELCISAKANGELNSSLSGITIFMKCDNQNDISHLQDIELYVRQVLSEKIDKTLIVTNYPDGDGDSYIEENGIQIITEILNDLGISFEREKTFQKLKTKTCKLRLDFYFEHNGRKYAIDYSCLKTSQAKNYNGGKISFKLYKNNDSIKNDFCQSHEIYLLRIDYRQVDIARDLITSFLGFAKK